MKRSPLKISSAFTTSGLIIFTLLISIMGNGQKTYKSTGGVNIILEGTSNIHDWNMNSDKGTCTGVFILNHSGSLTGMSALNFSILAESLKSEHKALDKNARKALNTDKYASISFTSGSANIKPAGDSGYVLTTKGKLTISGVTKDVFLTANAIINADKSITYSGSYKLKMTDYNVKPPSLMLGAIKTADDIIVKFNLELKSI